MDADSTESASSAPPRDVSTAGLIVAAALLAVAVGAGLWFVGNGIASRGVSEITVTGSARIDVVSDRVVWTINASEQSDDLATAVRRTNEALESVTRFLVDAGIDRDEIALEALSTSVNYEWIDGNFTSNVSSYSAYRNLTVRTDEVELIERVNTELGDVLTQGYVISAFMPEYYVTGLPELRPGLQQQAVADAQARAVAMLEVTGSRVGPVRGVRAGPLQVSAPDSVDVSDAGMYDTTTLDKTVTATVTVTFAAD